MLKFRTVTFLFCLSAVAAAVFHAHLFVWIILIFCYIALITYGSANIRSGFYLKAFCHGDRSLKKAAITFDDGPDGEHTAELLDLLRENGIKASFFCIGGKIDQYPSIVNRMHTEGHLIGNHSFSHDHFFPLKPVAEIRKELIRTKDLIEKLTGKPNLYFRPPFGVTNPGIARALKGLDFMVIGWSIRSFDLSDKNPEAIVDRILTKLRGGDIILLHDTSPHILPVLKSLLVNLKLLGWEVVRHDELINDNTKNNGAVE
ncbi:MAG: polysaccharide deacetylase family protein [Bacteroidota bacterium]